MLAARLGAWLRKTGERWAKAAFSEKLAVALALAAVIYTVVTGAAELRYQARAREALAQVKAARLAAGPYRPSITPQAAPMPTRPALTALPTVWPMPLRHWAHCPVP